MTRRRRSRAAPPREISVVDALDAGRSPLPAEVGPAPAEVGPAPTVAGGSDAGPERVEPACSATAE